MGGEVKEKTGEKCPVCKEETSHIGKPEGPKSEVCGNCGVLETLSVRVPAAFINFLTAYFDFCGYKSPPERYHADELTKESALIIRDIIDEMEDHDKAAIVDSYDLRDIFKKVEPNWLEFIDKDC